MKNKNPKISTKIQSYLPKKRLIIVGKGGSGKDHLKNLLVDSGIRYSVSHTTRPARNGESDGTDYHFVTDEKFYEMANAGDFLEHVSFNGWHYGTSKKEFEISQLLIMTPSGLPKLGDDLRSESFVLYIDIEEDVRRKRLSTRRDADDVERRLAADKNDFENFSDYEARLTNPDFTIDTLMENIIMKEDED